MEENTGSTLGSSNADSRGRNMSFGDQLRPTSNTDGIPKPGLKHIDGPMARIEVLDLSGIDTNSVNICSLLAQLANLKVLLAICSEL